MAWLAAIGQILKALMFIATIWAEKDKEKSMAKKAVAKKIENALKEPDKKRRASLLNRALDDVNGMR